MNNIGMEFVLVPKGEAWLGGGGGAPGNQRVEIQNDFYLGKYEVTQEEWEKMTGHNPSGFRGMPGIRPAEQKRFPVDSVSWDDIQSFVKLLNTRLKEEGWVYRLPSITEWEYACRGGPMNEKAVGRFDFYCGKAANQLQPSQANYHTGRSCKVGSFEPNLLGLYDMHGNLWEWCHDPAGVLDSPSLRLLRGGSWRGEAERCRASVRDNAHPTSRRDTNLGLRMALVEMKTGV
jgi:formylglycine-generating enzyme required for sulfatase activity